jgi:hypothetical protein
MAKKIGYEIRNEVYIELVIKPKVKDVGLITVKIMI